MRSTKLYSLIFFLTVIGLLVACQRDPQQKTVSTDAVAVNWTWKRTVKNDVNVIYGTIENKIDKPIKEVVLEFHTQDSSGKMLTTQTFAIKDLPVGAQKPFTQDYPARQTREDSGFVKVVKVIPAE